MILIIEYQELLTKYINLELDTEIILDTFSLMYFIYILKIMITNLL